MRKTQTGGMGCIYVAKIDFAENLFKQILYIVLSSNPLPPFNLFFFCFCFCFVIKGIGLQFTLFTLLKKRKLKFSFIIFLSFGAIFALLL